jgi:hypothetical protein
MRPNDSKARVRAAVRSGAGGARAPLHKRNSSHNALKPVGFVVAADARLPEVVPHLKRNCQGDACCYDDAGKCIKRTSISATHTIFSEDFSCESVGAVVMAMAEPYAVSSKQCKDAQR